LQPRSAITRWAFDQLVRDMAKMAESNAGTIRGIAPALIDEPGIYDTLETWLKFRAEMEELQRSGMHVHPPRRSHHRTPARFTQPSRALTQARAEPAGRFFLAPGLREKDRRL
jgi:hypothetical protein